MQHTRYRRPGELYRRSTGAAPPALRSLGRYELESKKSNRGRHIRKYNKQICQNYKELRNQDAATQDARQNEMSPNRETIKQYTD